MTLVLLFFKRVKGISLPAPDLVLSISVSDYLAKASRLAYSVFNSLKINAGFIVDAPYLEMCLLSITRKI